MGKNVIIYLLPVKLFLGILAALFLSACAPSLYHADFSGDAPAKDVEILFSAREESQPVEISDRLRDFYRRALEETVPEGCRLRLSFDGRVEERYASLWYLGIFVLAPLWPAMPRNDDISMTLVSELSCDGVTVERAKFLEEEKLRLFWYGPYRNGYVQERADMIHAKLSARIRQSLEQNVPTDDTIRSDFY